MRGQLRGAVSASVRESRRRRGKGEVANVTVVSVLRYPTVLIIFLDLTGEEIDVLVQKVVCVQVVSRRVVREEVIVVEIRGGEGV